MGGQGDQVTVIGPRSTGEAGGAGEVGGAGEAGEGEGVGGVGRRRVAGLLAAGALGAFAGTTGGMIASGRRDPGAGPTTVPLSDVGARTIPYHGVNQPGIVLPFRPQARAWIGAFDLEPGTTSDAVKGLLRRWTVASRALMAGQPLGSVEDQAVAAIGLAADPLVVGVGPAALTVTVGFGPSLFERTGWPRPDALTELPAFPGDQLDPARSGGAIGVVVAADDAVIVAHAARLLTRLATGTAHPRWTMSGFNGARGSGPDSATPRNLMGQVDGTNNPRPDEPGFATKIFVGDDQPAWLRGGSYLVIRRIRMLLDDWDQLSLGDQERVIGRRKDTGAPLSGGDERTPANFGRAEIPADAHIRHAAPAFNEGAAMLRRGFSFVDGNESGLLFLAWQADPRRGFIPVQRRLSEQDALRRFIRHEASALFAIPGGVSEGRYLAQGLVES
jgi:deferrochelatase/peroxidase EfeB